MNFDWVPQKKISKRIEQLNFQRNIQINHRLVSPTIEILKKSQKVRKTKECYEKNLFPPWKSCESLSWRLDNEKSGPTINDNEQKRLKHVLIEYEEDHFNKLELISQAFGKIIDETSGYLPMMIRNHHISLSGNLADINILHKYEILPRLKRESFTCVDVLNYLLELIKTNKLYCYVAHAMLYNSTLEWLQNYKLLLDITLVELNVDYNNLDVYDIIRLYKDWAIEMSNIFLVDPRKNADEIALCMEVEQKFCHLLVVIEDAKKIGCVKEISKNNIQAIEKLYMLGKKKDEIPEPMLILYPRHDTIYGYRNPIDLLKLGQFIRLWNERSMLSESSKCYYNTNLFIFERCIIYTIVINENQFVYNGHFWIKDCQFVPILKNNVPMTLVKLNSGDHQLILNHKDFVSAVYRLHELHKYEELDAEIELPFDTHIKILSKLEVPNSRLTLATCD